MRQEKYEFKDGQGQDTNYSVMEWYDKLPEAQRNLLKYANFLSKRKKRV